MFYCNVADKFQTTILAFVCGLMASSTQFARAEYHRYRSAMFSTALPLGLAIVYHAWYLYDRDEYAKRLAIRHLHVMAVCHIIGAAFYITQVSRRRYQSSLFFEFRAHRVDFV